jgi:deazaflavin-dependent oxidoreductase (nitroreductase family)
MAYLKPPFLTRAVFNKIAIRIGMGGSETLAVKGRRTGAEQTIPVIPIEQDDTIFVVSTRGESEWVRNVRSTGEVELRSKKGAKRYHAVEIPASERPPIITAYRAKAGRTVDTYWKRLPDPADHPTFRLDPIGTQ